jgi:hypothetical protein
VSGPLNIQTVGASEITTRLDALRQAIADVQVNGVPLGESVRWEPGSRAGDPIEVIIAPPSFEYKSNNLGPSAMIIEVYVIVVASDLTVHNLIALERGVADAIDLIGSDGGPYDATVRQSDSGSWRRGGADLPAYLILVEMGLS